MLAVFPRFCFLLSNCRFFFSPDFFIVCLFPPERLRLAEQVAVEQLMMAVFSYSTTMCALR